MYTASSTASAQKTIGKEISISGYGLHRNVFTTVTLVPSVVNGGRRFVINDKVIAADFSQVVATSFCTTLSQEGRTIQTVEHLLAALYGLQIDNIDIHVDGPEIPILDGSAKPWADLIVAAGTVEQSQKKHLFSPTKTLSYRHNDRTIVVQPAAQTSITIEIDFPHPAIGNQQATFTLTPQTFIDEIAPARTFGFANDLTALQNGGLAKGVSLQNTLAYLDRELHPEQNLRFQDEPLRHKLLDLIGDLALFPKTIRGHIHCCKPGHGITISALNHWFKDLTG